MRIVKVDLTNSYGIKPFLNINMYSPLVSMIFRLEFRWYRDNLVQFLKKIYSNYDLIA